MAFKLKPPYKILTTPIYERELEPGVMGKGNKNGTILIGDNVPTEMHSDVINHEEVHIDQIKRGDLWYDNKNVYWKGKCYPRSKMKEGDKNLPWEKEAYKNS
tara:strand:+ start:2787 stop:3092 length:306 start_codon:yes stop_codon:yes gene_type:complete